MLRLLRPAAASASSAAATSTASTTATATAAASAAPPPPPPPPPSEDLEVGAFETASSSLQYFGTTRCKRQTFKQTFTQANLYSVMRYEGSFRVCYKHGQGIVSYSDVHGDMTRGPAFHGSGVATTPTTRMGSSTHATSCFDYRGSAAFCVIPYACGPTKHPWVRIVFYDNNTLTKDAGVN